MAKPETAPSAETNGTDLIDAITVITERESGLLEAFVPIDLINQEEVAVDQTHTLELADSIKKESERHTTGQLTPILLGQVPGKDTFLIIDGFHRAAAMKLLGADTAYATIKTACTLENVIDLRIVAARSHKTVSFSRIVEWAEESWGQSPWADQMTISAAFQLNTTSSPYSSSKGVSIQTAREVRGWVQQKCAQWGVSSGIIQNYLKTARVADPALVKKVRERGKTSKEEITSQHLAQIVKFLPNNYPLQNQIADVAIANGLTIPETKALSLAVSRASDQQKINEYCTTKIWERMGSVAKSAIAVKKKAEADTNPLEPEEVHRLLDTFFKDQIAMAQLMIENAILIGTYTPQEEFRQRPDDSLTHTEQFEVIEELPEEQTILWAPEKVDEVAHKVLDMQRFLGSVVRRRFGNHFSHEDGEDIISTATIRFLTRVSDGRLPEKYADELHLRRLMTKFVVNAAIDQIRQVKGRNGQKPSQTSLYTEDEHGIPLIDKLSGEDRAFDHADPDTDWGDYDLIKRVLPSLPEKQRKAVVLKACFGLTSAETAQVIGSSEAYIHTLFSAARKTALKLYEAQQLKAI